jgi:hypothetical protein
MPAASILSVKDRAATVAAVKAAGGTMTGDSRPFGNTGTVLGFAIDPAGSRIELLQRCFTTPPRGGCRAWCVPNASPQILARMPVTASPRGRLTGRPWLPLLARRSVRGKTHARYSSDGCVRTLGGGGCRCRKYLTDGTPPFGKRCALAKPRGVFESNQAASGVYKLFDDVPIEICIDPETQPLAARS